MADTAIVEHTELALASVVRDRALLYDSLVLVLAFGPCFACSCDQKVLTCLLVSSRRSFYIVQCPRRHRSFLTTKRTIQCYSAKDASYVCPFASEATCPYMDHQFRPIPPPGYTPTAPGYVPPASWPAPPPAGP